MSSKKILTYLILLLISSRLFFFVAALLAPVFVSLRQGYLGDQLNPQDPYLFWVWANFDGYHYLNIAISGYQQLLSVQKFEFAFFPLYPATITILHNLTQIPYLYLGIVVSSVSLFLAMVMIYKIIRLDFNHKIALTSLAFLSFFPLSFFYHSVYTDSLFLLLTTSSFYFARKGNWTASGLFGALSTFDRLSGLALIPALVLEWYIQNKAKLFSFENKAGFLLRNKKLFKQKQQLIISFLKKGMTALLLTLAGFLIYAYYLQIHFGNWLLFQKSMKAWNQDSFVFPLQVLFRYLKILFSVSPALFEYWIAVLEFISFLLYMALTFYVLKKIRPSYGIFMFVLLLLVTFTGTLSGGPRYILHLFPAFLALAILVSKNRALKIAIIVLFLILGFILSTLFTRGYYIS
ncbi:MAG: hypothetical protein UU73_C0001G0128 [Candidatus Daviesbacteria bacterium GW2011_GWA1_41_61]|uniref:Glycosyltransferase RgtA/B/C/D-like domain-containing protein n=1 Tax=Candidatus Daviesbacteria bacterium GW2011_GWA2_40_9 TaxID=1618424 RepID=A0A0G0X5V1_9BACT|nr:MAG: hypothetical protein UU26_C0001G0037 [Candidatus Daviesbacteria bacterium GW2011_GWC1_40_9]KKR83022.1 MAG: hypothetical protein UU29_C0008G0131 [Candidatus Daviesbacteria bacterium GW2011_GWA2_40_9]KKR92947.1 MAG: hypothetical protein UU44_C0004G0129 [Candidatus Daviesbacteria bacterium GW2011_GWB1_41_15]KKS15491.1 MAG: hypothetical protein UU73_C0001G0128 [Candidatus Daviesbacteria bacterium GW2011_GWA1_41_61]